MGQEILALPGADKILQQPNTNAREFVKWMIDREYVERPMLFFENRIGTTQGLSPPEDDVIVATNLK